jgi:hypothetical protein
MPWMSENEIKTIEKYISKETVFLEYGSGSSTKYFSQLVSWLYSIEHDHHWAKKIDNEIKDITNISYKFSPPNIPYTKKQNVKFVHANSWNELPETTYYDTFESYIECSLDLCNLEEVDCVLVDGRARPECCWFIHPSLKDSAILFVHDYTCADREYYKVIEEKYNVIEVVDSLGVFGKC